MARAFNGTTQYLERNTAVVASFPVTLSCWIYLDTATGRTTGPSLYSAGGVSLVSIEYLGSGIIAGYGWRAIAIQQGYSSASEYRSGSNSTTGWHGFAASWGSYAQIPNMWVDGAKITGGTTFTGAGGTLSVAYTGIGSYLFSGSRSIGAGRVAYAAVWNAELTDAEMKSLTQATPRHPLFVRRESLQGSWDLGGHWGNFDRSPVGQVDLTAYGSPTFADSPPVIYPQPIVWPQRVVAAGGATPWLYARRRSQIIGAGGVH